MTSGTGGRMLHCYGRTDASQAVAPVGGKKNDLGGPDDFNPLSSTQRPRIG